MSSTSASDELHPEFYFDDSLVVIKVENTLFRVHKYQLNKSETFSNMFKMPQGPSKDREEGTSREHPIVLEGVKASDFAALLKTLYASRFSGEKVEHETEIIVPAFRLAHMWDFSDLRAQLLPLVKGSLGCVDRIVLARELGIQDWLTPAYMELCKREELPTVQQARELGIEGIMMLFHWREQFRPSQSSSRFGRTGDYCSGCLGISHHNAPPFSAVRCNQCGNHFNLYYRLSETPASTTSANSNATLEDEVKKWVEGGCVAE